MAKSAALLLAALLCGSVAYAKTPKPAASPPPKADPALLEFLGSWQASDGTWVDPMTFARIDPDKLAAEHARHTGKPVPPSKKANPDGTPPGAEQGRASWHAG
ncbi:MAG: hypothetical protein KGJ04_02350 [Gammaproteobacteria bacterium]|nr:hypothetical protein [Gammaproteobacteria bacterium]